MQIALFLNSNIPLMIYHSPHASCLTTSKPRARRVLSENVLLFPFVEMLSCHQLSDRIQELCSSHYLPLQTMLHHLKEPRLFKIPLQQTTWGLFPLMTYLAASIRDKKQTWLARNTFSKVEASLQLNRLLDTWRVRTMLVYAFSAFLFPFCS